MDGRKQAIEMARPGGAERRRVCADCGAPEEWTPDERLMLYHTGGTLTRIGLLEVATGVARDWLQHADFSVYGPRVHAPAGRPAWVVFFVENSARTRRIFAAPALDWRTPPAPETWVPITDGTAWDSSPVWSPAGDAIYFVSRRDGRLCVYAQAVHGVTRRPVGPVRAVRHFHSLGLSLGLFNTTRSCENLRVAADGIYLIPDSVVSNIWSLRLRR
jgi:hypothetical protein